MSKYYIIDKVRNKIFDFEDVDHYIEFERTFIKECFVWGFEWYWLNNMKVMVIKNVKSKDSIL